MMCLSGLTQNDCSNIFVWINTLSDDLKFTPKYDLDSVEFLDLKLTKSGNSFNTTLHRKSVQRNMLLHFRSYHSMSLRRGLPVGQFIQLRPICSTIHEYRRQVHDLKARLRERGYPSYLVKRAYSRASHIHTEWWKSPTVIEGKENLDDSDQFVGVLPFMPHATEVVSVLRKHWEHFILAF